MPSNFVAFQLELSRKALADSEINRVRSPPKAGPAEAAPAAAPAALSGSPGKALLAARREEEAAVRLQSTARRQQVIGTYRASREYEELMAQVRGANKERSAQAVRLQRVSRGRQARKSTAKKAEQRRTALDSMTRAWSPSPGSTPRSDDPQIERSRQMRREAAEAVYAAPRRAIRRAQFRNSSAQISDPRRPPPQVRAHGRARRA